MTRGLSESTSRGRAWLIAGLATAAALILIAGGFIAGAFTALVLGAGTSSGACDAASVADQVLPTIVTITVTGSSGSSNGSGEPVVALGAPLGLSSTVTAGIVSALGRTVPVPSDDDRNAILVGAIQTDASINPGNSGGALVDCRGRLVGVNTAIATVPGGDGQRSTGSVGIGFAVPQSLAVPIAHQLIDHGKVAYPTAGVDVVPIPHAVSVRYGVPDGLYVQSVARGDPAVAAGLHPGDVITSLNGQPAVSVDVLTAIQLTSKPGDKVTVAYLRGGRQHTATVTLAAS